MMSQEKPKGVQNIRGILLGENNIDQILERLERLESLGRERGQLGCKGLHLNTQGLQEWILQVAFS